MVWYLELCPQTDGNTTKVGAIRGSMGKSDKQLEPWARCQRNRKPWMRGGQWQPCRRQLMLRTMRTARIHANFVRPTTMPTYAHGATVDQWRNAHPIVKCHGATRCARSFCYIGPHQLAPVRKQPSCSGQVLVFRDAFGAMPQQQQQRWQQQWQQQHQQGARGHRTLRKRQRTAKRTK